MPDQEPLLVAREDNICTVTINNPEKHNAVTPECMAAIKTVFDDLAQDDQVRVVVFRGAGEKAFSAGADITAMPMRDSTAGRSGPGSDPTAATEAIQRFPYPVIAMLHGYTLGAGCILAMSCDIRIAADDVKMGVPTSRMGLLSGYPCFKRFFTVLGYSTALEIFLTGRSYDSETSLRMGLVNHVVPKDRVEAYTYELAREIIRCAPLSLKGSKYILGRIAENPVAGPEELKMFRSLSIEASLSRDHEEAKKAFKEKRPPVFKGR